MARKSKVAERIAEHAHHYILETHENAVARWRAEERFGVGAIRTVIGTCKVCGTKKEHPARISDDRYTLNNARIFARNR